VYVQMFLLQFAPAYGGWDAAAAQFTKDGRGTTWRTPLAISPSRQGGGGVNPEGSSCGASSFTCTMDGLDHLVSDDAAALGIAARRGTYTAMCGHVVYVAALASCSGPLCPRCAQAIQQVQAPVTVPPGRHPGRGRARLGRLFNRIMFWHHMAPSAFETNAVDDRSHRGDRRFDTPHL
jgi:hypothetical protein